MWVVTRDKEKVLNCYSFSIVKHFALKGYKYAIVGEYAHNFWGGSQKILQLYPNKEEAIKDLEKLNKSIAKGESLFKF